MTAIRYSNFTFGKLATISTVCTLTPYPEFNTRLNNIENDVKDLFRQYENDNQHQQPSVEVLKELLVWGIPTEKFYYDNRQAYYNGLNVGVNYYETLERLNKILPFLILLPQAVCYKPIE